MAVTAEDAKRLRDLTGAGLHTIKRAAALLDDPAMPFEGDLLWALFTVEAGAFAINVKGPPEDRLRWNIDRGARDAADLRERDPAVAQAFPTMGAAPAP